MGTAITVLTKSGRPTSCARQEPHLATETVGPSQSSPKDASALIDSLDDTDIDAGYRAIEPGLELGLPFKPTKVSDDWATWPALPELFPVSFPGVKSGRDPFVTDIDKDRLRKRIGDYFNASLSHDEIERRYPLAMRNPREYDSREVRNALLKSSPNEDGLIRYAYRPFDTRWLYWEAREKLVDRPRIEYKPHVFEANIWMVSQQKTRREWSPPQVIGHMGSLDLMDRGATCIPAWLREEGMALDGGGEQRRPNLSDAAQRYLDRLGLGVEDLFHHVLAVLHDPSYREANAGALRMEWPRIPLPGWPDGDTPGAAEELAASAARGRELAALLDSETPVPGVTTGALRPEMAAIAVPSTTDGGNMAGGDFAVTASWGHYGSGDAVMPGRGSARERAYTPDERAALGGALPLLGDKTFDIHLNDRAYWRNVPAAVWNYQLGGYQVLKKWLSYREQGVLGRALSAAEVQHFTDTARRIAAILRLVAEK